MKTREGVIITKDELIKDKTKYIPIYFDLMFKEVFGNIKYPNNTAYLTSVLLDIPYEKIKGKIVFKSNKNTSTRISDKHSEKDVVFLVDYNEGYKINIEVNMSKSGRKIIVQRNLYYVTNLHGSGLKEGETYESVTTTIQCNLNNFDIDEEKIPERHFFLSDTYGVLSKDLEVVHFNIAELAKLWYDKFARDDGGRNKKLSGLCALMFKTEKDDFHDFIESLNLPDNIGEDIERIVEYMNADERLNVRYYNWEEEQERINKSILKDAKNTLEKEIKEKQQELINQGLEQKEHQMIISMKEAGISLEKISEVSNIPIDELKDKLNN